jgi:plasmid stability protein
MEPESFDAVAYKNAYTNEHYDRFSLILPKGTKRELQAIAARQNQSMNAVITTALTDMINREQQKRMRRLLHYKENLKIPQEFKILFWDTSFDKLDVHKNARYIIPRLYMLGDAKEMYWLHKTYSDKEIMDVARKSRGFDDVSANYLSQKYSIDRKDMAYYVNKEKTGSSFRR